MCNKHYTTSVKTRFTFVFYTDSYIRGINHIFSHFSQTGYTLLRRGRNGCRYKELRS